MDERIEIKTLHRLPTHTTPTVTLLSLIYSNPHTVRNMGYEKGKFMQAEGKLVKWVENEHYSPFGRN